jgi:hypothetical protein
MVDPIWGKTTADGCRGASVLMHSVMSNLCAEGKSLRLAPLCPFGGVRVTQSGNMCPREDGVVGVGSAPGECHGLWHEVHVTHRFASSFLLPDAIEARLRVFNSGALL